jgi:hypothetical protein
MARDHHPGVWLIQKDIFSLLCHDHLAKTEAGKTTTTPPPPPPLCGQNLK